MCSKIIDAVLYFFICYQHTFIIFSRHYTWNWIDVLKNVIKTKTSSTKTTTVVPESWWIGRDVFPDTFKIWSTKASSCSIEVIKLIMIYSNLLKVFFRYIEIMCWKKTPKQIYLHINNLRKSCLMGFELHKMYFVVLTVCNLSKLFRGKGSTGKPFHKFCFVTNKV